MVELQRYWDKYLSSRAAIDKINGILQSHEKELTGLINQRESVHKQIKDLKNAIKQDELSLTEMSVRIKKLEDRKKIIKTEKELHALEKEIDVITFDSGKLEEKTLSMIDELDLKERDYSAIQKDIADKEQSVNAEKSTMSGIVTQHEAVIMENKNIFDTTIEQLSTLYRSKFLKMVNSRDGTGIARVEGETCGFCNTKIPSFLAIDASKVDKVVNCTNCGKFIYK